MSRTDLYRLIYILVAACFTGLANFAILHEGLEAGYSWLFISVGLVLLGIKVQHYFWQDHFLGRHEHKMRRWNESLEASQKFIREVEIKPRLRHLVWLSYMVTSRDIVAVTQNNVACAYMAMGDFSHAEVYLSEALKRDPLYPVPHLNRAKIQLAMNNEESARRELGECRRLGFRKYTWEALCKDVREALGEK
jgi:tetratricopeptide (TPR) repeat protein